jgi:malonyl CoA-acyl carrier protein transacylase
MSKKRVVVIAPGRGTYTANELGYLQNNEKFKPFLKTIDTERKIQNQLTVREMDSMPKFKRRLHTLGENAAALIYACSMADFFQINRDKFEIVASAGNSMGWYTTLSTASATNPENAIKVVNTMGSMMKDKIIGGQIVYPILNDDWTINHEREAEVFHFLKEINLEKDIEAYLSIRLGGNLVLGGNEKAIKVLLEKLPPVKIGEVEYPFQLINHAAFHTPVLNKTSEKALSLFSKDFFGKPQIPMIDGRGKIWYPHSSDLNELYQYTFGHQVKDFYDFSKSIEVAVKEFAPDHLVLLGPGSNLGGSIAQVLIDMNWLGLKSKEDFIRMQKENPFLISMGREDQKRLIL